MIRNFEIQNFKKFTHWVCDGLTDFNVIFGGPDSGKTSFLEAICAYTYQQNVPSLLHYVPPAHLPFPASLLYFFHKRDLSHIFSLSADGLKMAHHARVVDDGYMWECNEEQFHFSPESMNELPFSSQEYMFIPRMHLPMNERVCTELYRYAEQLGAKEWIVKILSFLDPIVTDIDIQQEKVVLIHNHTFAIELSQCGSGMRRMFELFCGFIRNQNQVYCVDIIEYSFHPLVNQRLPECLRQFAHMFNVQLFLTTESHPFCEALMNCVSHENDVLFLDVSNQKTITGAQANYTLSSGQHLF